jgi:demethoxyubiquinone hydroxylase (CLK1/Coq7/Cat5 family)
MAVTFHSIIEGNAIERNFENDEQNCSDVSAPASYGRDDRRINMPVFGAPFSGLADDRKLTPNELIRSIRFMVAAECEATQLYTQLAESTDNKLAVKVLKEIADEERVHVGEFLRLLYELAPTEEKLYAKGAKEVEDIIQKMK